MNVIWRAESSVEMNVSVDHILGVVPLEFLNELFNTVCVSSFEVEKWFLRFVGCLIRCIAQRRI